MALPKACTNKLNSCVGILTPPQPEDVSSKITCASLRTPHFFVPRSKLTGYKKNKEHCRGFTFIEVMMVLGMLAIIGSLGMLMSMETMRGDAFRNDRNAAVSALQRARSLAINNICMGAGCVDGMDHGAHFDPDKKETVIFQGDSFDESDPVNEAIEFDDSTIYIDASTTIDIVFARITGNLIVPGNTSSTAVILRDTIGHISTIDVNSKGRIDWTN